VLNEELDLATAGKEAYSTKKLVLQIADRMGPQIQEARRGVRTWEETDKAARELAEKYGFDAKTVAQRARGEAWNAEQLRLASQIFTTAAVQTQRKVAAIMSKPSGERTEMDMAEARLAIAKLAAIESGFAGAKAESGRAQNTLRRIATEMKGKQAERITELLGDKDSNEGILQKIAEMDPTNVLGLSRVARDLAKATTVDKLHEVWINMLLSHPLTHDVNLSSNALTTLYRTGLEKPMQATYEAVLAPLSGRKRQVTFGEMPAELYGMARALPEGARVAAETFMRGTPSGKAEAVAYKAVRGVKGDIVRLPTRLLGAADDLFKTIIRRGVTHSMAYRTARLEGLKGEALAKRMAEIELNPPENIVKMADKEAAYRTYTNPLGEFGKTVLKMRQKAPWMKLVVPFITTPTNIAKFAIERTPIGFLTAANKIAKKQVTKEEISDELAKATVGTLLMAGTAMLASQGFITGGGPKDKDKRYDLYRTGWKPYSVKIGDKYYSFARLEPLGSILGMGADVGEMMADKDERTREAIAERMAFSLAKNVTSKTYLQGVSGLIDAIHEPERYGEQWVQKLAGTVVPSGVAGLARASDKELKEVDGIRDLYASRLPGLTQFVCPRRDLWGNPIEREGNFWTLMFSPVQISAVKGDPIDKEIVRLDAKISGPKKSFDVNETDRETYGLPANVDQIELTPKEYDRYAELAGKQARVKVATLMQTKKYRDDTDEGKESQIRLAVAAARRQVKEQLVESVASRYRRDEGKSAGDLYAQALGE